MIHVHWCHSQGYSRFGTVVIISENDLHTNKVGKRTTSLRFPVIFASYTGTCVLSEPLSFLLLSAEKWPLDRSLLKNVRLAQNLEWDYLLYLVHDNVESRPITSMIPPQSPISVRGYQDSPFPKVLRAIEIHRPWERRKVSEKEARNSKKQNWRTIRLAEPKKTPEEPLPLLGL